MSENSRDFRVGLEAAIALSLMAAVPVFVKFTSATPFTIGFFRLSIATALFVFFLLPGRSENRLTKRMVFPLFLIGVLFSIHWITYFLGIKMATASIGLLGISTYGIHLIFIGWIVRGTKPNVFDFLALMLAIAGTVLIIPEFSFTNDVTLGLAVAIFSGFCFATLPVLHQHYGFIPERLRVFGQFFFAWCVFMFLLPWTNWKLQAFDWWALLYLAIPGTFIAHSLWVRVTTKLSTTVTSLIFYLLIPLTMFISHYWLGEPMPLIKVSGAAMVVLGNVISMTARMRGGNY